MIAIKTDSWDSQASSIIFVDSPVGTGFSYAEDPLAYETGDLRQVQQLHQFLRKVCPGNSDLNRSNSLCTMGLMLHSNSDDLVR